MQRHRENATAGIEPLERRLLMAATVPQFVQTNLISDGAAPAATVDHNLVNPWGIAVSRQGMLWVSDNGQGLATVYGPAGGASTQTVTIPAPRGASGPAAPTGVLLHNGRGFNVSANGQSAPAIYLFATEDGTISGWNPAVSAGSAVLEVDNSAAGAVYKGIALAGSGRNERLYAANFRAGRVDVFDSNFAAVSLPAGAFTDATVPAGFAPFNVVALHGKLYVSYAKQNDVKHDDVSGAGNGFVDVYTTGGKLVRRFASGGALNSPWAITQGIGRLSGDILVGNFGDGRINIFTQAGKSLGPLTDTTGAPISIEGLWDVTSGRGKQRQTLYFAAGINAESDGLFGTLTEAPRARRARLAASTQTTSNPAPMPIY